MSYGIYIHYPYCVHKCSYCDFYSLEDHSTADKYADLIIKEIDLRCKGIKEKADTIFFGGGTPSLMKPSLLFDIRNTIEKYFDLADDLEFTLECNPGTIDIKYLEEYKKAGVNRISFGVQSFNDSELEFLERIHSPEEVFKAFSAARETGFDNISLDLIFAIPGQTLDSWANTIEKALSLSPDHISTYSLIYEEGTPLHRQMINKKFDVQSEDNDIDFYNYAVNEYKKAGFEQYEVSNYAKNGMECKHNLKYWRSEEYYAFGPSAHGYVNGIRYANHRSIGKYINSLNNNKLPVDSEEELSFKDKLFERLYLEFRAKGLRIEKFKNDFDIDILDILKDEIDELKKNNYIFFEDGVLKLTTKGYFVGDSITLKFMEILECKLENNIIKNNS